MTPAQFSRHMAKAAAALPRTLAAAEGAALKQAKALAVTLSSGTLTRAELRRRGHPYAVRNPTSPNPQVINAQGSVFRNSFQIVPTTFSGRMVSSVINVADYSGYLANGTRFMVKRPLPEAVQSAVRAPRLARTFAAVERAWLGR